MEALSGKLSKVNVIHFPAFVSSSGTLYDHARPALPRAPAMAG